MFAVSTLLAAVLVAGAAAARCEGGAVPGSRPECPPGTESPAVRECDEDCQQRRERRARIAEERRLAEQTRRDNEAARRHQREAVRLNERGIQAMRARQWDRAQDLFRQALREAPDDRSILANLGDLNRVHVDWLNARGVEAFNRRRFAEAERLFREAYAIPPERNETLWNLSRVEDWQRFTPNGNGLVGGTGWQVGWNLPPDATAEERRRAYAALQEQSQLSGRAFGRDMDLGRYNFAIAVAHSNTEWIDLLFRVQRDQWGRTPVPESAERGYSALRGRRFDELGCHSNGAMICLLALMNDDVRAREVVLYGPQVTPEALDRWNELLARGRIRSLRIYVSENDPITPLALLLNSHPTSLLRARALLTNVAELRSTLVELSPRADVRTLGCGADMTSLDCHSMRSYTLGRGCSGPQYNLSTVPGTRIHGRGSPEPPSPTCRN